MSAPLVSVVIPSYNLGQYINETLESVLQQTLSNIEVIVVDGGSKAETIDVLKKISHPKVTVYYREGQHLVGSNRNFGIERSHGKYICCLDSDDKLDPTYLEKAIYLAEAGDIDVVSSSYDLFGARTLDWQLMEQPTLGRLLEKNAVSVAAVFRKSVWAAAGGYFDTGLGRDIVAEDWDFWTRLGAHGARFWNISREYLLHHRQHEGPSLGRNPEIPPWTEQLVKIKERSAALFTPEAIERSAALNSQREWRSVEIEAAKFEPHERTCMLFMPWFLVGGAERLFLRLCKYLIALGWKPVIVATRVAPEGFALSKQWFDELGIESFWLPNFLPETLYPAFARHLVRTRRPSYIINGGSRVFYELIPQIKHDYPGIVCADFLFNPVGHSKSHLEYQWYFDLALAESPFMRDWYVSKGWPEERVHIIAVGIDLELFHPRERPSELADRHGIGPDDVVVGYIGRMSYEKGPMQFIEIVDQLSHVAGVKFIMAGDGAQSNLVKSTITAIASAPNIRFLGVLEPPDVAEVLNLCDIVVVPSRHDGRPLIVLEAAASGVPVVASRVGAIPDLVEDGKTGFLCDPGAINEMGRQTLQLIEKSDLRKTFAKAARHTAEAKYSPDAGRDHLTAALSGAPPRGV
jgi:glycosyltransferase involved in cell wall biosynthesis